MTVTWFNGLTCIDMINAVLGWLSVAEADYNRYTKTAIVQALNQAAERFARLTLCIQYPAIIIGKQNKQFYTVPQSTIEIINPASFYTADTATGYQNVSVLRDAEQMRLHDSAYRGTTGTAPNYLFQSFAASGSKAIGLAPIPNANGLAVAVGGTGSLVMNADGSETDTVAFSFGDLTTITNKTGNLFLTIARKPTALSAAGGASDSEYSEIPPEYHDAVVAYAVYLLGRRAVKGVSQPEKAKEGSEKFIELVNEYNGLRPRPSTYTSQSAVQ